MAQKSWTTADFEVYRTNYGMMLDIIYSNPIISNILNNVARPSQLEGYVKMMIDCLRPQPELLLRNITSMIKSEFIFVSFHKEPFVFLRERSRIAARSTGDYVNELMRPVLQKNLRDLVEAQWSAKIRILSNIPEMVSLFQKVTAIIYSDEFISQIPKQVRYLVYKIFTLAQEFNYPHFHYVLTGNLLFLRCVCPALSVPEYYQISRPDLGMPPMGCRKVIVLMGKILNNIANYCQCPDYSVLNTELDEQLVKYKDVIQEGGAHFKAWVDKIIGIDFSEYEIDHPVTASAPAPKPTGTPEAMKKSLQPFITGIKLNPRKYPLLYLACVHHALIEHHQEIVDCVMAMHTQVNQFKSKFEQDAHLNKFTRLISGYSKQKLEDTKILDILDTLIAIIKSPPPVAQSFDYTFVTKFLMPKVYNVTKVNRAGKAQKRLIKFTPTSMMNVDGDLDSLMGIGGQKKGLFSKGPVVKNDVVGGNFTLIRIEEGKPEIYLELDYDGEDESSRTYILENPQIQQQILGEIIEICFLNQERMIYKATEDGQEVTLRFTKDSIMKLKDDKIIGDAHFLATNVTQVEHGVVRIVRIVQEKKGDNVDKVGDEEWLLTFSPAEREKFITDLAALRARFGVEEEPDLDKFD